MLAGSAGVASAATASVAPPDSWFGYMVDQVECAFGSHGACMALNDAGPGVVSPDAPGDPKIQNK